MFFPLHVYKHLEIQQTIIVNKKEEDRNFEQRTVKTRNKKTLSPVYLAFQFLQFQKQTLNNYCTEVLVHKVTCKLYINDHRIVYMHHNLLNIIIIDTCDYKSECRLLL